MKHLLQNFNIAQLLPVLNKYLFLMSSKCAVNWFRSGDLGSSRLFLLKGAFTFSVISTWTGFFRLPVMKVFGRSALDLETKLPNFSLQYQRCFRFLKPFKTSVLFYYQQCKSPILIGTKLWGNCCLWTGSVALISHLQIFLSIGQQLHPSSVYEYVTEDKS